MGNPWLQIFFLCLEITSFTLLIIVSFILFRKNKKHQNNFEKISEILMSAPLGYFYFFYETPQKIRGFCSRRLCVLLNIYDATSSFECVLAKLDAPSVIALRDAVEMLQKTGKEFHISIQNEHQTNHLEVTGLRVCSIEGEIFADVLWFRDETDFSLKQKQNERWVQALQTRDKLFTQALDSLPFPLWMRNPDLTLAYCNSAYATLVGETNKDKILENNIDIPSEGKTSISPKILAISAKNSGQIKQEKSTFIVEGQPKMLEIYELPLSAKEKKEDRATLGFAQDVQKEEQLRQTLQNYLTAQYQVLSYLSCGISIFDANGYLQFYNQAFCQVWKLEEQVVENRPSFSALLDILREKRILPEEVNFIAYKHSELDLFSSLTKQVESILHLPTGQILKRSMSPYPLGGVAMTFEDITDRFTLERSFNEQIAIQKSIINHTKEGLIVFDKDGRLKLCNPSYAQIFSLPKESLLHEPLLLDVIEEQKNTLCESDDVWQLLKEKILTTIEEENNEPLQISSVRNGILLFKCIHLPDGGLLLSYERKK